MNTHILIPLTEELIEAIDEAYLEILYQAMQSAKQISLDERDISAKAEETADTYLGGNYEVMPRLDILVKAYKQALKDLNNES